MYKTETLLAVQKVAEYQSFTKAAHSLGQTPMAVSKQVSGLEKKLKQPLFERTTRTVRLTEFGQRFLEHANHILQQHKLLDEWLDEDRDSVQGTIKVVAQSVEVYQATIYPWLAEFVEQFPELDLELDIDRGVIDIEASHHDIYWGVGGYLGKKKQGLRSRLLVKGEYGVYAAPSYIDKFGKPKHLHDLKQHKLIGYLHNQPNNILLHNDKGEGDGQGMGYSCLDSKIKAVAGLIDLAVEGLGLINLPTDYPALIQALESKKLTPVLQSYWWKNAEVFLYYHQVKYQQAKVRAFIDFFIEKREQWL